jgi:hypothetical protein
MHLILCKSYSFLLHFPRDEVKRKPLLLALGVEGWYEAVQRGKRGVERASKSA